MNESKKMALLAVEALEDKKAEDITIIDISEVSVLADYFIIADGSNRNQVQAMTGFLWTIKILLFMYLVRKTVLFMI